MVVVLVVVLNVVLGRVVVVCPALHTVPIVGDVMQTAVRVVGVGISRILVVGLTPTVMSALP